MQFCYAFGYAILLHALINCTLGQTIGYAQINALDTRLNMQLVTLRYTNCYLLSYAILTATIASNFVTHQYNIKKAKRILFALNMNFFISISSRFLFDIIVKSRFLPIALPKYKPFFDRVIANSVLTLS